eukprot:10199-Eustigmatos_ZCMA.PRE.1
MHTFWVRLNAVVFFGFTVLLCLSVLTAFRYGYESPHASQNDFGGLDHDALLYRSTFDSTVRHKDFGSVQQLN